MAIHFDTLGLHSIPIAGSSIPYFLLLSCLLVYSFLLQISFGQHSRHLRQPFGFFQSWMFAHLLLFRSHSSSLHYQTVFYCFHSRTTASSPTFTISSLCNLQMSCNNLFALQSSNELPPTFGFFQSWIYRKVTFCPAAKSGTVAYWFLSIVNACSCSFV